MTLSELIVKAQELESKILEANGELSPELDKELVISERDLVTKIDQYAMVMERLDLSEEFLKRKEDEIKQIRKGMEYARTRMRDNVKNAMRYMSVTKLEGDHSRFTLSKCKAKLEVNESTLDAHYTVVVSESVPDTERIRTALEMGEKIVGAELKETYALRIGVKR